MWSAGLDYDAFPAASADDAMSRTLIMQIAETTNSRHSGCAIRWGGHAQPAL
jgi:hypothetical protein